MTDDGELRRCVGKLLDRRVAHVECRRSMYSTSFPIDELDVRLDDGSSLSLVRKDLSRAALLPEAVAAKPAILYDPLREIEVYASVLSGAGLGTAAYHGACVEPDDDRYWLFLERVQGVELWQVGDFDVWLEVARWLARFHRSDWLVEPDLAGRLVRYDREFYGVWAERARTFQGDADAGSRRRLDSVLRHHDQVVDRLVGLETGFIHGELYASNVLVGAGDPPRVCPIDWEVAGIGPHLFDVAALVSGRWSAGERLAMVRAYAEAASPAADLAALAAGVDLCRLHLCVRWLGWAPGWSAPPEHAHDWLSESVEIAEAIGW